MICRIVPPFIIDSIATRGNRTQRQAALDSIRLDRSLTATRLQGPALRRGGLVRRPTTAVPPRRNIFDAQNEETLPGVLVRAEGDPPTDDAAVDEAYDGLGDTFTMYRDIFGRNSIDDEGMELHATVHFGQLYENAFWDGARLVFGDGDGELFHRFTIAVDIIGHELTHGVLDDEAGLVYNGQSGALNESLADVFGSLVKQRVLNQAAGEADWLIGAGLFTDAVNGVALRSMKEPGTAFDDPVLGKDPQPSTMSGYVDTLDDNGGVHINSGIPNRAFALAAIELGGHAWEKAGQIWYDAVRDDTANTAISFVEFAALTIRVAENRFGAEAARIVRQAWDTVEVR